MPATVERLADQPILIVNLLGNITIDDLHDVFARSVELTRDFEGKVYRINIIGEDASIGFGDVIATVRTSMRKLEGSSGDPRFRAVWVGKHHMAKLFADMLRSTRLIGAEMPFFNNYEEATAYVTAQIMADDKQAEK